MASIFILIKQEEVPFSESDIQKQEYWLNIDIGGIISSAIGGNSHGYQYAKYNINNAMIALQFDIDDTIKIYEQKVVGPKLDAPQVAIEGFYRKYPHQQGFVISKSENNYVAIKEAQTKTAVEVAPSIVEAVLLTISKQWKETLDIAPLPWTRPIHSISAFLDGKKIHHKYEWNHSNEFTTYDELLKTLPKKYAINLILEEIERIEKEYKITCTSRQSVEELAWLYPAPQFCLSAIPQKYLTLPKEILKLTIAKNQRYIMCERGGNIVENMLIVGKKHNKTIEEGHIKTLKARLDDAIYYLEKDIKAFKIDGVSPTLEKITFHQRYGSVAKRVQEMGVLAQKLFPNDDPLQQAIVLCKNDLTSNIVQSFTELQGYCGGYYLEKSGVNNIIATAVAQHYKPLNPNDDIPSTVTGAKLSLIDKLQKVNSLAEIGEIPTSSRDPFAIRRDILSIIRICVEHKIENIFTHTIHEKLQNFVQERVKLYLKEFTKLNEIDAKHTMEEFKQHYNFGKLV